MSTTPAAPPAGTPPPAPQTAAELAAANAASQATATPGMPPPAAAAPPPPPAAPSEPTADNPVVATDLGNGRMAVKYLTGEKFEGTQAEILAQIGRAHVTTKTWAQAEVAKAKQPPPPATPPPPSKFTDDQERDAANYASLLVAKSMGYDTAEDMQRDLARIRGVTTESESQNVSIQFQAAAPDFNDTPENAEKLLTVIGETVGAAFDAMSRPQQIRQMQMAHAWCLQTGQYQPKPTAAQPTRPIAPPPAPIGGRPADTGGHLPAELAIQPGDSQQTIIEKWDKAAALGLAPARTR